MDEIKLVKKAKKGDTACFSELIKRYEQTLYRISMAILKNDHDCADAIQSAILKAYEKMEQLKQPQFFKTWLTRILINECHQLLRFRSRVIPFEITEENGALDKAYETVEVAEVLEQLPEDTRLIITLFYFEGMKIKEITELLSMPEGTVKTILYRGRKLLAAQLLPREGDEVIRYGK